MEATGAVMTDDDKLPRVLVVDDSRMVRASIVKHVRGRFEIREEPDGEAGWEALLVDPGIDLVLSDIAMPRLDGYGLLERIRASKLARVRELPVVIISGDEDEAARERALGLGANGFISKGAGSVELLATLTALLRLAKAQSELAQSRAALARQSPIDPATGLASGAYLDHHGAQSIAQARRYQSEIAALVIEVDQYDALAAQHGEHVVGLIIRKLSKLLAGRIRAEDTLSQHSASQFALLSPGLDLVSSCAFALRLRGSVEKLLMAYREERIRVTLTIGVASSAVDGKRAVSELLGLARARAIAGRAAGGNRVVAERGEVDPACIERELARHVSIDAALRQLRTGAVADVDLQLRNIIGALMPLFELVESRLHCGLPLGQLQLFQKGAGAGSDDGEAAQTSVGGT